MLIGNLYLSALFAWVGASSGGGVMDMTQPLRLIVQQKGAGIEVVVEGASQVGCDVRYELRVASGSPGNRNESVQRGVARLSPGQKVAVARTMFGANTTADWTAKLIAQSCGGDRYEIHRSGNG